MKFSGMRFIYRAPKRSASCHGRLNIFGSTCPTSHPERVLAAAHMRQLRFTLDDEGQHDAGHLTSENPFVRPTSHRLEVHPKVLQETE
jgi:hypothetical protein